MGYGEKRNASFSVHITLNIAIHRTQARLCEISTRLRNRPGIPRDGRFLLLSTASLTVTVTGFYLTHLCP